MEHEEKEILIRLLRESEENSREIARIFHVVRRIENELVPKLTSIRIAFTAPSTR
jgi:hypothetical protein